MGKTVKGQNLFLFLLGALIIYLIAWNPYSPAFAFAFVIILFFKLNRWEKPIALILFGQIPIFWFFNKFGVHGAGYYVLLPIVFLLLIEHKNYLFRVLKIAPDNIKGFLYLFLSVIILSWSYGPKNEWATLKLFSIIGRTFLGSFALLVFLNKISDISERNEWGSFFRVGLFGLFVCILMFCSNSQYIPLEDFGIECWKKNISFGAEAMITGRLSGAAFVLLFLSLNKIGNKGSLRKTIYTVTVIGVFSPIMIASGERQTILGIFIAVIAWSFLEKKAFSLLALFVVIFCISLFIFFAQKEGNKRYFLKRHENLIEYSGRASKLERGYQLWKENPLFGVGLGGFNPGIGKRARDYAHNLILEIMSETGMVGLIVLGGFLIFLIYAWPKNQFNIYFGPIWAYYLVISMASLDLPENVTVFIIPIGIKLFYCGKNGFIV